MYLEADVEAYGDPKDLKDLFEYLQKPCKSGNKSVINYRNEFELSLDSDSGFWAHMSGPETRTATYIGSSPVYPSEPLSILEDLDPHLSRWRNTFNKSPSTKVITDFIEDHAKSIRQINNVIGLGLGRPGSSTYMKHYSEGEAAMDKIEFAYFQHMTILHIAEVTIRVQGHAVRVRAQDPIYSTFSKHSIMQNLPGIEVIEDPEAFLMLDSNTFLFHCHMPFDASAIALSLAGDDGLAGLMCAPLRSTSDEATLTGKTLVPGTNPMLIRKLLSNSTWDWSLGCVKKTIKPDHKWYGHGQEVGIYLREA
ncbi:hypothetical protein CC86DRAFT_407043 [Ophiobolus disseminans]|uniref:SRR1-like domain-containing protein n=1 Tax=Ophiobolus disseminans TaxID=1469910 RepID=A0A6A6ZZ39_9PLEO|nr:hypothetical protein CC86DRAFT_407043 [Ophiobolus disseminans]